MTDKLVLYIKNGEDFVRLGDVQNVEWHVKPDTSYSTNSGVVCSPYTYEYQKLLDDEEEASV